MNMETGASAEGYADPTSKAAIDRVTGKRSRRSQMTTPEQENFDRMVRLVKYVAFTFGYRISNWIEFEKMEKGKNDVI